jgi:hypothetical protein
MAVVVVLSVVFILCPLLGYIVLISNFTMRQKIAIGFVGVFLMMVVPLIILFFTGSESSY